MNNKMNKMINNVIIYLLQLNICLPNITIFNDKLYIFGGEVIKPFAFAMIIGVLIGTYSSIFIAVPTLLLFKFRPQEDE